MINIVITLILITVLLFIFFQDYKDRMVYWFLYPLSGILCFIVHAMNVGYVLALTSALLNFIIIALLVLSGFIYSVVKGIKFINGSMGIGDILLFCAIIFSFSTVAFAILFTFSLIFSLLLHIVLRGKSKFKTVPLAGYIAVFFAGIYTFSLCIAPKYLFS